MNVPPKVSIVIPFYNCPYVDQAIESALGQDYPNLEVIVVNDGSTMHAEKIRPYLNRIRYVEKDNGGTATALNTGIQLATGDYFSWLSSDDIYEPRKISRQLAFMLSSGAKASYTSYIHIDGSNQVISGPAGIGLPSRIEFLRVMQRGCIINGCTVMLHMEVFRKAGLFNPGLRYTQDYDMWLRTLQQYHLHYLDEPLVRYRVHEAMGSRLHEEAIKKEIAAVQEIYHAKLDEMMERERLHVVMPMLTLSIGGAQRMLAELANGLARKGHRVTVVMPQNGVIEYSLQARIVRGNSPYIIEEKDIPSGDLIVSNYYTMIPACEEASKKGKGVLCRLSLCYEPTFLPDNHETFRSYHKVRHVFVLSQWQKQILKLNHGIDGYIVPVGVSNVFTNHRFRDQGGPLQISAILRRPEGGLSWHREQEYLIEQLEIVKSRHPEVQINLFSPPNEFVSSPSLQAVKAGHPDFRYLTPADDREMCYHYNETHIFVNSSTYDTASMPGLEAMKCGAALATVYGGGNLDYCRHEVNGLMSYRYENRLALDIIRLIENPELRKRLAAEGEKEAAAWTWERSVNAFEQAIKRIVQNT